jgi:transporter family protein
VNTQALIAASVAMLAWGAAAICDKFGMRGVTSPLLALTVRLTVATVAVYVYALSAGVLPELRTLPRGNLLALAIGGLLASLVAQGAYFMALRHADVSRVVPFTASYPVIALVLAVLLLREPLTLPKVVGTLMIIGGLMLVSGMLNGK